MERHKVKFGIGPHDSIRVNTSLRPLGNTVAAHALLFDSLARLENLPRMPVAQLSSVENPKTRRSLRFQGLDRAGRTNYDHMRVPR